MGTLGYMDNFIPNYTAKILKHGKELVFDFSHNPEARDMELIVADWCETHKKIAEKCSSFIMRLPNGDLKNYIPHLAFDDRGERILQ